MKTLRYVIINDPIPASLPNPALVSFDEEGKIAMVAINDPFLYSDAAKAHMLKCGTKIVMSEATLSDLEALKAFAKA